MSAKITVKTQMSKKKKLRCLLNAFLMQVQMLWIILYLTMNEERLITVP